MLTRFTGRESQGVVRLVYGACGCYVGQKAMALATCMLRVCTYACAVIDMSFRVVWDFALQFRLKNGETYEQGL